MIAFSVSNSGLIRNVVAAALNRFLIARRKRAQCVLHPIAQLPQHCVRNIERILRDEKDADALGANQAHDLFDLFQQRFRRIVEQQMRFVEEKDQFGFVEIANFGHPFDTIRQAATEEKWNTLWAIGTS